MKQNYTLQEIKDILWEVYEYYNIQESKKFIFSHFSGYQDAPPDSAIEKAFDDDIESFLY